MAGPISIFDVAGAKFEEYAREDWLGLHRTPGIITASMVPTILGLNKYESPFSLWQKLKGLMPWGDESFRMRSGHGLEPIIADEYTAQTGRELRDPGEYAIVRHPDLDWLLSTIDRVAVNGVPRDVELKSTEIFSEAAAFWRTKGIPIENQVQVQAQLSCLGWEHGSVAAMIGLSSVVCVDVVRSDDFIATMLNSLDEFRDMLITETPPPVGGSEPDTEALKALHPKDNGKQVFLSEEAMKKDERLQELKLRTKSVGKEIDELQNWFKNEIGDNSVGVLPHGGSYSWKWQERAAYEVERSEYRTFRRHKK